MCGSNMRPWESMENWQKWHKDFAADPFHLGLTDFSGDLVSSVAGSPTLDERHAQDRRAATERQAAFLKQQYEPAAPEKSAMEIGMNEDVRNRRRRAVLLGVGQLENPGPGGATGGGYGGASTPLY